MAALEHPAHPSVGRGRLRGVARLGVRLLVSRWLASRASLRREDGYGRPQLRIRGGRSGAPLTLHRPEAPPRSRRALRSSRSWSRSRSLAGSWSYPWVGSARRASDEREETVHPAGTRGRPPTFHLPRVPSKGFGDLVHGGEEAGAFIRRKIDAYVPTTLIAVCREEGSAGSVSLGVSSRLGHPLGRLVTAIDLLEPGGGASVCCVEK